MSRGIFGLDRWDSGWAAGSLRRAYVQNCDNFSGAMRSLSFRGWLFGQDPTDNDQKKSNDVKAHRYNFLWTYAKKWIKCNI